MTELPPELLAILGNLGIGAIFFWTYLNEKKERQELAKKKDELSEKLLEAYNKSTSISEKMTATIDNNTEAVKSLSTLVYDVLKDRK